MTKQTHNLGDIPDVVLILGTDAAGKDHVANILSDMIHEAGGVLQKRRGLFSASPTRTKDSTRKSFWEHAQERLFIALYPYAGPLLPIVASALIAFDTRCFSKPKGKLIVVGHHALRALAFHLGRTKKTARRFKIPDYLNRSFAFMREKIGAHIVVLDVHHHVRHGRVSARHKEGRHDFLDLYMLQDPERSERIEACLVKLATRQLGSVLIENNDATDHQIRTHLLKSFRTGLAARKPSP